MAKLTETIVRQVGDLRWMVDEFSSFARMPKPVFREESLLDIARQMIFLHEVAKPEIGFSIEFPDALPPLVCNRRQLGQGADQSGQERDRGGRGRSRSISARWPLPIGRAAAPSSPCASIPRRWRRFAGRERRRPQDEITPVAPPYAVPRTDTKP